MEEEFQGFSFLPDNVLELILSRVSVKTLGKLMCVSKHFKSLILNPLFKSLHHKNTIRNPPSLLILSNNRTYPHPPVLTTVNFAGEVMDQWDLPITGCLRLFPSQSEYNKLLCFTDLKRFFLCNPSTKRCIQLPESYPLKDLVDFSSGFAYLPCKDEYVIVQLYPFGLCAILTLSISNEHNLIYNGWKLVKVDFDFHSDLKWLERWAVFASGFFYWLMGDDEQILCFDVENEKFSRVDLPPLEIENDFVSLFELQGDIYITNEQPRLSNMELWKLNDDQMWSKKYNISTTKFGSKLRPIFVNGDGEILFFTGKYLKYYNPKNGTFKEAGEGKVCGIQGYGNVTLHTDNMFFLGN